MLKKTGLFSFVVLVMLLLVMLTGVFASQETEKTYLIALKKNCNIEKFLKSKGLTAKKHKKIKRFNLVVANLNGEEFIRLKESAEVVFVEEDSEVKITSEEVYDDGYDFLFSSQMAPWGVVDVGGAKAVENQVYGDNIKIAVLDTGIINHPDLTVAGGAYFVDGADSYVDDNGHGTHVTGTIAASNNSYGVLGVAPNTEIYAVKVLDKDGLGTYSQVIQGIDWAIQNNVNIVSIGFGGNNDSLALHQAIQAAASTGMLLIAPSGNSGAGENTLVYPAQYPEVVSVGAIDRMHQRADFSSTGPELDIVAPGVNILSTMLNDNYGLMSGTSTAVPHVVGAAASLWSYNTGWTAEQVKQKLYETAVPLGDLVDYGHGMVALDKALGIVTTTTFDIIEHDRKLTELSKNVQLLIKQLRDINNMPLAEEIEQQYNVLMERNAELHMLPDYLSQKEPLATNDEINNYFATYESTFVALENDYKKLLSKYRNEVPGTVALPEDSTTMMSYNFQGDEQTIQPGGTATVSLQLFEPKTAVYIKVFSTSNWNNIIASKTYTYNPPTPAGSSISYTWNSSSSIAEGSYHIQYSYPNISTKEYFTIYVRRYSTLSLNTPVDVVSPSMGWFHVFKFTPSTSGTYTFYTSPRGGTGPSNDTYLQLFADSKLLDQITSDDDSGGNGFSKINRYLNAGRTYYIKLSAVSYSSNYMVNARLTVSTPSAVETINLNSPIDVDLPTGANRVYKFTAPSTGSYRIFTGPYNSTGAMNDTYLELYTDSGLTNRINYNDDIGSNNYFSEINHNLTGGNTYYIKLRPFNQTSGSVHARLTVSTGITPIYFNTPVDINLSAGTSKVYKFTPSSSANYRIHTGFYGGDCDSGDSDTILSLYSDSNLTSRLDRNDDSNGTLFSEINYNLTGGKSYYIKIEGWDGKPVYARLLVDYKPAVPPSQPISGTDASPTIHTSDPDEKDDWSFQHEPIDLSTGAQVIENTLLNVEGAQPVSFDVRYDSLMLNQGPLGRGWVHNFETCLKILPSGEVLVYWNSNRINSFVRSGANRYSSSDQAARYDTLIRNADGSFVLTRRDQSSYNFNRTGKLVQQKNSRGQSLIMAYDNLGRLSTITEPVSGRFIKLQYNSSGLINLVSDNMNRNVFINYDAACNLTRITDAKNQSTTYTYDTHGWMLTLTDAEGIMIFSNTYDDKGRVTRQIDAVGNAANISYDETSQPGKLITTSTNREGKSQVLTHDTNYRLLSLMDELGNLTSYTYDANGNRTSVTDPYGKTTTFSYDERGNLLTVTNPAGQTTTMTYDERNNLLTVENAAHKKITYTYDLNNNILSIADQAENRINNVYDTNGLLLNTTKPGGGQSTFSYVKGQVGIIKVEGVTKSTLTYDAVGRLVSKTDNRGKTITMNYDNADNLLSIIDPLGNTVSYAYDRNNRKISETDAKGNITRFTYDGNGNITSKIDALNNLTNYEYDKEGRLIRLVDPKGNATSLTYDAKGRIIITTYPGGNSFTNRYDALDRLIEKKDTLGNTIESISYDVLGNPLSVTNAVNSTVYNHYDILNRVDRITDPLGRITNLAYDDLNRLVSVTDSLGGVSSQYFDADGNRVKFVDPNNNQTLFTHDKAGKIISKTLVAGKNLTLAYNGADLVIQMTNGRGQVTSYQYDDAGRLLSFTDPAGTVSYTYDANGNITSVSDSSGIICREYDALNRLVKYTDSRENIIQYQYDQAGNLTELVYPDGKKVIYGYDNMNRLISVTDWANRVTSYEYDANGRLIKTTRSNGTILTLTYDVAGRVTQQRDVDQSSSTISQYDYSYDAIGSITTEQSAVVEQPFTMSEAVMTYTYDNRLDTFNGQPVIYDADGNMTCGPLAGAMATYTFDSRNRLTRAGNTNYTYDAENNRISVSETVYGNVYQTSYVVNPQASLSQVLVKSDAQGRQTYYVYGLGLIGQEEDGTYLTYHYDLRGSTIALSDSSGIVTDRFQYGPYGELVYKSGGSSTQFLYNGRDGVMSDGNGLYYMRARYYNPVAKRFINQDVLLGKIDRTPTLNRYSYVNGNPISYIDPFGLAACEFNSKKITKVLLINDDRAVPISGLYGGHNAVILIDSNGWGVVFSFAPSKYEEETSDFKKTFLYVEGAMKMKELKPADLKTFKTSGKIDDLSIKTSDGRTYSGPENYYSRYISIDIDNNEGQKMYEKGTELFNEPPEYSAQWNNCSEIAYDIMYEGADIELSIALALTDYILPNDSYDMLSNLYPSTTI
ncbi:MAG: hypothetical protein CVU89_17025 [Firmicutes bacterium HGW-Firmicutes-14]|nr:MAG: hypothetical protein CVU89_17025 [Firmicutes bacterium HGW-Firmicutes-14]